MQLSDRYARVPEIGKKTPTGVFLTNAVPELPSADEHSRDQDWKAWAMDYHLQYMGNQLTEEYVEPKEEYDGLTATNCLAKLAVNTINADVIAREGGVQAILLSIEANPELDSQGDAFTRALELLNGLCDHQRTLAAVADSDMVARLLKLLQARLRFFCRARHHRDHSESPRNRHVP